MKMNEIKCPKCSSTNVQKQAGYAGIKHEGQSAGQGHVIPNECREESCRHKWYDEE